MGTKKIKITHRREDCIGCGSCAHLAPDTWSMNPNDGLADLRNAVKKGKEMVAEIDEHELAENKKAAAACPVNIIRISD